MFGINASCILGQENCLQYRQRKRIFNTLNTLVQHQKINESEPKLPEFVWAEFDPNILQSGSCGWKK